MDIGNYTIAILLGITVLFGFTGIYGSEKAVHTGMENLSPTLEHASNDMMNSVNNTVKSMESTIRSGDWTVIATDLIFTAPMNAARSLMDIIGGSMELFGAFFGSVLIMPQWSVGMASVILWTFIILAVVGVLLKYDLFRG